MVSAPLDSSAPRPENRLAMPPKETIWIAEPHTIAKHRILRKYLDGWLPVISSWKKRVLFR